jgi:hypothetical protein
VTDTYRDDLEAARARIDALEIDVERLTLELEAIRRDRARLAARAARWEQHVTRLGERYVEQVLRAVRGEPADDALLRSIERHLDLVEASQFRREIANYVDALAVEGKKLDPQSHDGLWTALDLAARD